MRDNSRDYARLFLYDVTSSYLEGELNALAEFGYNYTGTVRS